MPGPDSKVYHGNLASEETLVSIVHEEDVAHASGDKGVMSLAVRHDAGTALAADGDYIPLSTDATGQLRVAATFNEAATAADGGALPALTKVVSGYDGSNVQVLSTDAAGELQVDVVSSALPVGAATEATLATLDGKVTACNTGAVTISSALPAGTNNIGDVDVASSALPTGAATSALQTTGNSSLSSIDGKLAALGQAAMAGSVPVAIASNQTAIPASQSGTWDVTNISGTVSLPTGAATEASLASLDGKVTACNTGNVTIGAALPAGTNNIGDVDVASSALPTGAATESSLATVAGAVAAGQMQVDVVAALPAGSNNIGDVDVVSSVPAQGFDQGELVRNDYTSVNVTTGAYVQLVASTARDSDRLLAFDSSGQTLKLAVGAAASEVDLVHVPPGGLDGAVPVRIPSGSRLSVRAVSATADTGELTMTLLG